MARRSGISRFWAVIYAPVRQAAVSAQSAADSSASGGVQAPQTTAASAARMNAAARPARR